MKRELTELEEQFISEAEKEFFEVGYDEGGFPYAMGAEKTGNLFSMEVIETPDHRSEGSFYTLRY